ncbi:PspC domain-containing protein [Ferrimonas marina]|uniref:Phage shock protein C (PspC) family protein n=1 Tax=Ferrimonas marina TaxID=299255 RepID=A0A1M5X5W6_9GAMM|nr:PspC domain-containing protein [Ferrimonas marina]SHH95217.1 phage shock protein C (PspC) family protein [Ferrimonas marina]
MNGKKSLANRWWFGVAARLAYLMEWPVHWVRIGILALTWLSPVMMLFLYLMAAWLMPRSWRGC